MIKKYLHTRFRVFDIDKSISFRGSKLVFLKFPDIDYELELCFFPDSGNVHVPEDLVHLAFEVDDLERYIERDSRRWEF